MNNAATKMAPIFRLGKILERLSGGTAGAVFFKGAAGSFAAKLVGAGLLFFAQVLLARLLGVSRYGIYAYVLSWMTVLAIFAKMGFETSLLRFLPEYSVKRQWPLFRGVIRFSFTVVGLVAVGLFVFGHVLLFFLRSQLDADLLLSFRIMLFVLPLFAWTAIRQSCLRGLKRVVHAEVPEGILRPLFLATAAWLLSGSLAVFSAAWAWLCQFIAVFFSFLYGTFLLSKALPDEYKQHPSQTRRVQWIKVSSPMLLMNSMNIIMAQASIVILGFYQPAAEVALFSASIRIVILATFALLAVNSIAAPLISELYFAGKKDELQSLLRNAAVAIAAITTVAGLVLLFGGRWILGLFGSEFLDAYILLQILVVGFVVKSLVGPASYVLNLTGHQNVTAKAMLFAVVFSLVLNFFLIPRFGALGAATALSLTMIIWNVTLLVLNVSIVGINPSIGSVFCKYSRQQAV